MKQMNILVVDDDRDVCELLEAFLVNEGHQVRTLGDPTEAIGALKKSEYHLVILDFVMPELSGLELLTQFRHIGSDIAVIALTGKPSLDTAAESTALDVSAYITKPVSTSELRGAMSKLAGRTKLSVSLVSQIERAESSASISTLFKVANALDVKLTTLFGDG